MEKAISPSIMCADLMCLQDEIEKLEMLNIKYIHIDFMDGKFVPNITFGLDMISDFKRVIKKSKRDIHIMAYEPQQYFEKMSIGENDIVSVHYEACKNVKQVLETIKNYNAEAYLAISPDTDVNVIKDYLSIVDGILVMTVYPGFAGQPLAPHSMERINAVRKIIDAYDKDILIEVDGNVSWQNIPKMSKAGANLFVAGTSSVFSNDCTLEAGINKFYDIIEN